MADRRRQRQLDDEVIALIRANRDPTPERWPWGLITLLAIVTPATLWSAAAGVVDVIRRLVALLF